jgi:hypothetical protein
LRVDIFNTQPNVHSGTFRNTPPSCSSNATPGAAIRQIPPAKKRTGQGVVETGYKYRLLKFDRVSGNKNKKIEDPQGSGAIEDTNHLIAQTAYIEMSNCRRVDLPLDVIERQIDPHGISHRRA